MSDHKIYEMPFADVFPHYVAKIERKAELSLSYIVY